MGPDPGEITQLLRQWGAGDRQVEDRLFDLLMPDLHQIAERCFRRERPGEINHLYGGRGVYFDDPNGHVMEIITHPYGDRPEQI